MANRLLFTITSTASLPLAHLLIKNLTAAGKIITVCLDIENKAIHESTKKALGPVDLILFPAVVSELTSRYKLKSLFQFSRSQAMTVHAKNHFFRIKASKLILKKTNPSLIISSEDGISGNFWLLSVAKKMNIPRLVCPYALGSYRDLESTLEIKHRNNELILANSKYGEIIKRKYPQWVKKGKFAGALIFPPEYIIPLEKQGVSIPNPWTIQGGNSNKIAVESPKMYQHYINEGLSPTKLELCGTAYCDILYEVINSSIQLKKAFDNAQPIKSKNRSILICLLPNYDAERGQSSEFSNYREMIFQIITFLKKVPMLSITISAHPSVDNDTLDFLNNLNITVNNKHILELIPQHDIYLSCFSSTIRWAIACGKPVINYDVYKFSLTDYKDEPAVITINQFEKFKQLVLKLIDDTEYMKVAKMQKQSSSGWGVIDGKNFDRIHQLIKKLAQKQASPNRLFQKLSIKKPLENS